PQASLVLDQRLVHSEQNSDVSHLQRTWTGGSVQNLVGQQFANCLRSALDPGRAVVPTTGVQQRDRRQSVGRLQGSLVGLQRLSEFRVALRSWKSRHRIAHRGEK